MGHTPTTPHRHSHLPIVVELPVPLLGLYLSRHRHQSRRRTTYMMKRSVFSFELSLISLLKAAFKLVHGSRKLTSLSILSIRKRLPHTRTGFKTLKMQSICCVASFRTRSPSFLTASLVETLAVIYHFSFKMSITLNQLDELVI